MGKSLLRKSLICVAIAIISIIVAYNPMHLKAEENEDFRIYVLSADDVPVGNYDDRTSVGTNDYFTLDGITQHITVLKKSFLGNIIKFAKNQDETKKSKIEFSVSDGKYAQLKIDVSSDDFGNYGVFRKSDDTEITSRYVFANDIEYGVINNIESGEYYIARTSRNESALYFCRIEVEETSAPVELEERLDWDMVAAPKILDVWPGGGSKQELDVLYSMPMGINGADYVEIYMYDSDGNLCTKGGSMSSGRVSLIVPGTDEYYFKIVAKRYSGEQKGGEQEDGYDFTYSYKYQLTNPSIYLIYNIGGGIVNVDFKEVKEATSYIVEYSKDQIDWEIGAISKTNTAKIYGLDVGEQYYIRVIAKREDERIISQSKTIVVSNDFKVDGTNTSYGPNKKLGYDRIEGSICETDVIRIFATGGKVVRRAADGFATSYTKVKANQNFTISANIHVDTWTMNNEQNGCGIFISDTNGEDTNGWNNILVAGEQAIIYTDEQTGKEITQSNGIGVTLKTGLDKETVKVIADDSNTTYRFEPVQEALEERYPENKNIIGNWTNTGIGALDGSVNIIDFKLSISKVGTRYIVTYESIDGTYTNQKIYDCGEELLKLDEDGIYVGLFAARNTTATFTDVTYTLTSEADYSKVDAAIKKANSLDKTLYKDFSRVEEAVGKVVRGYLADKQGYVDLMAKDINDAIKALELIPVEETDDDGTTTTKTSTSKIDGGEKTEVTDDEGNTVETKVEIKNEPGEETVDSQIVSGSEDDIIDSILTDKEKEDVQNGAHVSFSLKIVNRGNEVSNVETKVIAKKLKNTEYVGAYIDITIEKTIGRKFVGVAETKSEITISLTVPDELKNVINEDGKIYQIARNHDGIVEMIDAIYDQKTNQLTFTTDRFSTYAIISERDDSHVNHEWVAEVKEGLTEQLVKQATCKEAAQYKKYCSVCNALSEETFSVGEPLAHTFELGKCKICSAETEARLQTKAFATRMYTKALNRDAEDAGVEHWTNQLLAKTMTAAEVAVFFLDGEEIQNKNIADDEFVNRCYATLFDRAADEGGFNNWMKMLETGMSRKAVLSGFCLAPEYVKLCDSFGVTPGTIEIIEAADQNINITAYVNRCYIKTLGRVGDRGGLNHWAGQIIRKEIEAKEVAHFFITSEEFTGKNIGNEAYVEVLYQMFLDRTSDEGGRNYWVGLLNDGTVDRERVFVGFAYSEEFDKILATFGLQ